MKAKIVCGIVGAVVFVIAALFWLDGCALTRAEKQITPIVNASGATNTVTNTIFVVDTNLVNNIKTAATAAAPFVPPPYNALVAPAASGLGWVLGVVASIVAAQRNKQANAGKAVVGAIETLPDAIAQQVKDHVAATTASNGTAKAVDKLVQSVTV